MTNTTSWITQYAKTSEQFAKSANDLLNLAVAASLEWAPAVMSFWSPPSTDEVELSEFIDATSDSDCKRILSVAKPFRRVGAPSDAIGAQSLVFVPSILRVHATCFRVGVKGQNYSSGTYRGSVRLTSVQAGVPRQHEIDVTVDL